MRECVETPTACSCRADCRRHRGRPGHRKGYRGALSAGGRTGLHPRLRRCGGRGRRNRADRGGSGARRHLSSSRSRAAGAIAAADVRIESLYGQVDILVNNAGVELDAAFH